MTHRLGFKCSATIAALIVFSAINCAIVLLYQAGKGIAIEDPHGQSRLKQTVSHLDLWDEVSIESTFNQFHQLVQPPNIVLMGSSLMMYPMFAADKGTEPRASSGLLQYHHATALQDELRQSGIPLARVYNLATPLQMVSDSYYYVKTCLRSHEAPQVLVLGVAPRDFWDALSPQPGESINFSDQYDPVASGALTGVYLPNWQDQLAFEFRRGCLLWDKRGYVQNFLQRQLLSKEPVPKMSAGTQFAFGLDKYKIHYRGISMPGLQTQMGFLTKVCQVCQSRHVKLIVVNMPLPKVNRDLLPAGLYASYKEKLRATLADQSVRYVDLSEQPPFDQDFVFCDAAHMNLAGGEALVERLTEEITRASDGTTISQNTGISQ